MKRTILLLLFVLAAVPAFAQTVIPTDRLGFDEDAPSLAEANRYAYLPTIDGVVGKALTGVSCAGAASPFACVADYPALTSGTHTLTLTATDGALASVPSVPFSFAFSIVPSVPRNLRNLKGH